MKKKLKKSAPARDAIRTDSALAKRKKRTVNRFVLFYSDVIYFTLLRVSENIYSLEIKCEEFCQRFRYKDVQ